MYRFFIPCPFLRAYQVIIVFESVCSILWCFIPSFALFQAFLESAHL